MAILPEHTPQFYLGEMTDQFTNIHRLGSLNDCGDTRQISVEMARSFEVGKNLMHYLVVRETGFNIVLHPNPDAPADEDISAFTRNDSDWLEPSPLLGAKSLTRLVLEKGTDPLSNPVTKQGEFYYGNSSLVVAMSSLVRVIGDGRCSVSLQEKSNAPADTLVAT